MSKHPLGVWIVVVVILVLGVGVGIVISNSGDKKPRASVVTNQDESTEPETQVSTTTREENTIATTSVATSTAIKSETVQREVYENQELGFRFEYPKTISLVTKSPTAEKPLSMSFSGLSGVELEVVPIESLHVTDTRGLRYGTYNPVDNTWSKIMSPAGYDLPLCPLVFYTTSGVSVNYFKNSVYTTTIHTNAIVMDNGYAIKITLSSPTERADALFQNVQTLIKSIKLIEGVNAIAPTCNHSLSVAPMFSYPQAYTTVPYTGFTIHLANPIPENTHAYFYLRQGYIYTLVAHMYEGQTTETGDLSGYKDPDLPPESAWLEMLLYTNDRRINDNGNVGISPGRAIPIKF